MISSNTLKIIKCVTQFWNHFGLSGVEFSHTKNYYVVSQRSIFGLKIRVWRINFVARVIFKCGLILVFMEHSLRKNVAADEIVFDVLLMSILALYIIPEVRMVLIPHDYCYLTNTMTRMDAHFGRSMYCKCV